MQNITAELKTQTGYTRSGVPMSSLVAEGAFEYYSGYGANTFYAASGSLVNNYGLRFDASKVARTASETRGSNTAFAPRIIAF